MKVKHSFPPQRIEKPTFEATLLLVMLRGCGSEGKGYKKRGERGGRGDRRWERRGGEERGGEGRVGWEDMAVQYIHVSACSSKMIRIPSHLRACTARRHIKSTIMLGVIQYQLLMVLSDTSHLAH